MIFATIHCGVFLAAANPLDPPEIGAPVKIVVIGVIGLLTVGVLVLTFAKLWIDVLVKRPTATVNIQAHSDGEGKEGAPSKVAVIDVTGFVAAKDFETHKEEARLRAVGLEKQISDLRHEWKDDLNAYVLAAKNRDEEAKEWRGEISEDVKETGIKLAGVQKQADMIQATLTNMDAKLDRQIERTLREKTSV